MIRGVPPSDFQSTALNFAAAPRGRDVGAADCEFEQTLHDMGDGGIALVAHGAIVAQIGVHAVPTPARLPEVLYEMHASSARPRRAGRGGVCRRRVLARRARGIKVVARRRAHERSSTAGRVLAIGGARAAAVSAAVDVYDPVTNSWAAPAASLLTGRYFFTATVLQDGRVLVTGGLTVATVDGVPTSQLLASTEIYDPIQDRWTPGPDLPSQTFAPRAVTLGDGRVLVVGGLT